MNNLSNEDAVIELLTLTCEVNEWGAKIYRNKEDQVHRIYGPAVIWADSNRDWYKNGKRHREDGPAVEWEDGSSSFFIEDIQLSEDEFIQWQKKNGIKTGE